MFDYSKRRLLYLHKMGIPFYIRKNLTLAAKQKIQPISSWQEQRPMNDSAKQDGLPTIWLQLYSEIKKCTNCALHQRRTQAVPGVGDIHADWMLIGEAPGFEEDKKGEPFVGRAGRLLNKMLAAIGLDRRQVYITNVVKCRPPENRNPRPEETTACEDYLHRQIQMVKPKIILALGRIAANALLNSSAPVGKLRGRVYYYQELKLPIVITYHPAYLLRSPQQKRAAWDDLKLACRTIGMEIS